MKGETAMKTNLTYQAGSKVGKGTYWDLANGQRIDVEQEAILTGAESATYFRIPVAVMLIAGPIIGLLYVICVPVIGIVTVASHAVGNIIESLLALVGTSLSFEWRPGEAYLEGKKKGKKKPK